jgi:hypothetical protein
MTIHRFVPFVLSALLLCAGVCLASPSGAIIVTDHKVEAGTDTDSFEKELKAAAKTTLAKSGDNWHVYYVAYLRKAPGAEEINVVFYVPGSHEPVNAYPLRTRKDAKILVSDLEIKPEEGFKAGQKYSMRITRLISGREEVYAQTTLELK